jgi:FixJ family two-component response regulator
MTSTADTVVVVDDDPSVREALASLVRSIGLRVKLFSSAQEFLLSPRLESPSCVVLDVRLPGLSGLDCQRQLHDGGLNIPVIFITGHGDIPMSVRAMKAGAVEFLTKPFRDQDLLDAIHQALDRDRTAREQRLENSDIRARYDTTTTPRESEVIGTRTD